MDTPEKKPLPSPSLLSKFEDSPVFNYISSLSPIKPFKSGHSGQSFHLLTFASPQSSQASPAICPKEPNSTSALHVSDAPKNCSESGYEGGIAGNSGAAQSANVKVKEDEFDSGGEVTVRATEESSKLIIELPKSLKYDSGSPENVVVNCDAVKQNGDFNVAGTEIAPLKAIQHFSKEADCSFENVMGVQRSEVEQNKGVCDWEKFIYEASDILKYCSPIKEKHHEELGDRNVDTGMLSFVSTVLQPPHENVDETQKMESACPHMSSESHTKITLTQPGVGKPHETSLVPAVQAHSVLAEEVVHSAGMDDKEQQTTRRRCLVYEMSGAHYRKLLSDPVDTSPTSKAPASPKTTHEKCLGASRPGSNKFTTLLPGIGLHLNALAAKSRDKIIVGRQTLTCRRQLISSPRIMPSCDTHTSDPKPLNIQNPSSDTHTSDTKPLNIQNPPDIGGKDGNEHADEVLMAENACQISPCGDGTELHQSSPKKKRRKSDIGENESCKRCNCKRSKCLKLYCECFAAGLYCVEPCNCQDCFNKPIHEETVLETRRQIESRNPLAFAPKVIKCSSTSHTGDEANKTPASARHKRGCNCKKSGCLKKYCECFQGGVGCSLSCRCEGCKNTFGRKEGIDSIVIYEETQMLEKSTTDSCSQDEVSKTYEENQKQEIPVPSKSARHPYHFGGMVPHSISLPSGTSLQRCKAEKIDKSDDSAIDGDVIITLNDEDSEVLQGDYSLPTCVKSASPNCKRVSPPHCDYETSPGWKSCRKLILRSIPPFPSMSPEKKKHTVAAKDPMK